MIKSTFYIGSYTIPSPWAPSAGDGKGIASAVLDESNGAMETVDLIRQTNPAFLAFDRSRNLLLAVTETQVGGLIAAYRADHSGRLSLIGELPTGDDAPCHVSVFPSSDIAVVSHYHGGSAVCIHLDGNGVPTAAFERFVSPTVVDGEDRRFAPVHMHACLFLNKTELVLIDSGRGLLMLCELGGRPIAARLRTRQVLPIPVTCEPRHMAWRPSSGAIYVSNQADSSAAVIGLAGTAGTWRLSLKSTSRTTGLSRRRLVPSEIAVHPTLPMVYMANRYDDSITAFQITDEGNLDHVATFDVLGRYPRHFAISPSGAFLLVANQDSNQVHSFVVAPDGRALDWTGHKLSTGSPSCIIF